MKRKLLIGSLVSAVFLYLALRDIEWGVLWSVLKNTRLLYLVPAIGFTMLGHYSRAYRWRFMLLPVKSIATTSLFSATAIGFMANNLLPARLGELVRAYVLGRKEQISRTASFATIVYERIVDVFSLLVLLWVTFAKVSGPEWLRTTAIWILVVNVVAFVVMLVMERSRNTVRRLVSKIVGPFPGEFQAKIHRVTEAYLAGLAVIAKPKTLLPIALTSVPVWFFAILGVYYCFGALDMHVPVMANVTVIILVAMGSMIPSAPAYLGTTQYACIVSLAIFGVGKSEALAYSLLYHATQFFPITLVGFFLLWRAEIRFEEITKA
ncbi:MAG: flippase-like domain-containing protein [Candidatus Latescibacterota bacterium]|nr:MAG: flippase-like domain-containing protein [Candidatus Latescibacterota bacterium]